MRDYLSWSAKQFRQIVLPSKLRLHMAWGKRNLKGFLRGMQNYPGTELSKNSAFKRTALIKQCLCCMRPIWGSESVQGGRATSGKVSPLQKLDWTSHVTETRAAGWQIATSVVMNSWADRGNDRDKLLKSTWRLLTLWPMMLLSTISITHYDRTQIPIQHAEWTSHLFCFYPRSPTPIWTH